LILHGGVVSGSLSSGTGAPEADGLVDIKSKSSFIPLRLPNFNSDMRRMMVEEEPTHDSQHEVACKKDVGFNHQAFSNILKVTHLPCFEYLLLHDDLEVENGPPNSSDSSKHRLFEPVMDNDNTGQGNASLKHTGHLVESKGYSGLTVVVLRSHVLELVDKDSFHKRDQRQNH